MKQPKVKSSVIYSGPSMIDGKPIVCIAIVKSSNIKTGDLIQTYIIRSDISPLDASRNGSDESVCGTCVHRGLAHDGTNGKRTANGRTCYVNLGQGPTIVYKAFQRGVYPVASTEEVKRLAVGRMVRLGTYGDSVAVPSRVWNDLLSGAQGHTGYTHQHDAEPDYHYLMASADTASEALKFHTDKVRTFRVIPVSDWSANGKASLLQNEALCPASKEAGYKSTCDKCKLCAGSSLKAAKSIAIVAHGTSRNTVRG
jgi:hypothetical protein